MGKWSDKAKEERQERRKKVVSRELKKRADHREILVNMMHHLSIAMRDARYLVRRHWDNQEERSLAFKRMKALEAAQQINRDQLKKLNQVLQIDDSVDDLEEGDTDDSVEFNE